MGPKTLSQVLRQIDFGVKDENLLVGLDTADDATVYKLDDNRALIQSVDFFTPVVDDPYLFGQVAACNALSDIYAMGGKPLLAMNIVCFPDCLDQDVLVEILKGGADKAEEAGAIIAGGHTVRDDEPKYGLAVSGMVEPENLLANSSAQPGDKLILTKPIGTGIMITALKGGLVEGTRDNPAVSSMLTLNDKAVDPMKQIGVNACTDITGFGLLGHVLELARGSNVEVVLDTDQVPLFTGVKDYAEMGMVPGGAYSNQENFIEDIEFENDIPETTRDIFFDPQTSGGLLISVSDKKAAELVTELHKNGVKEAAIIGEVKKDKKGKIRLR